MRLERIEKHYEEEVVLGDEFKVIRLRSVVSGSLTEEESKSLEEIKKASEKLYKLARVLTKSDVSKEVKEIIKEL